MTVTAEDIKAAAQEVLRLTKELNDQIKLAARMELRVDVDVDEVREPPPSFRRRYPILKVEVFIPIT